MKDQNKDSLITEIKIAIAIIWAIVAKGLIFCSYCG